ncbi:hypothetical protein A2U01_0000223 [Trifolium medium]|uniref:RNA-directed DNA polymerase (Reverse transcriptase) n=1 Tax=Trifolium medium TaxID=97028 RepID=A0A392LXV3_9FABA|nr:hypothetical protein [Trifolium medium]
MARLEGIQSRLYSGHYHGGLRNLEAKVQEELILILKKEELMWFQRSRAKWLADGDRNTRYYHLKTVSRRRRNNVVMLRDDQGVWIEESEQVHDLVNNEDWFQTDITYPVLENEDIAMLAASITQDEVKHAVFCMSPWKAPGPDGFPAGFLQHS